MIEEKLLEIESFSLLTEGHMVSVNAYIHYPFSHRYSNLRIKKDTTSKARQVNHIKRTKMTGPRYSATFSAG